MASSALSGANLLDDDITAEDRLAGDAEASHGSLLDDEREADIGLEVQSDAGIMADMSAGDDAVRSNKSHIWEFWNVWANSTKSYTVGIR